MSKSTSDDQDSWAAVAKGAIIKSLGLYTDKPPPVKICPRHYGITARSCTALKHEPLDVDLDSKGAAGWAPDQIRWFVRKGDVIFPNRPVIAAHHFHWSMKASDFESARQSLNYGQPSCSALREVVFVASPLDAAPARLNRSNQSKFSKPRRCLEAHFSKVETKSSVFRAILPESRKVTPKGLATKTRANISSFRSQ